MNDNISDILENICGELKDLNRTIEVISKSINSVITKYCDEDGWKRYDYELSEMNKKLADIALAIKNLK